MASLEKVCPSCMRILCRAKDFYRRKDGRGGYRTASSCKQCQREAKKKERADRGQGYLGQLARRREYWQTRREVELPVARARAKSEADQLTPHYIATALRMKVSDVTDQLRDLKRAQISMRRMARQLRKGIEK